MHYKNGRKANDGDPVVAETHKGSGKFIAGTLNNTNATTSTCNGQIAIATIGGVVNHYINLGEIYHAEDAFTALDERVNHEGNAQVPPPAAPVPASSDNA